MPPTRLSTCRPPLRMFSTSSGLTWLFGSLDQIAVAAGVSPHLSGEGTVPSAPRHRWALRGVMTTAAEMGSLSGKGRRARTSKDSTTLASPGYLSLGTTVEVHEHAEQRMPEIL